MFDPFPREKYSSSLDKTDAEYSSKIDNGSNRHFSDGELKYWQDRRDLRRSTVTNSPTGSSIADMLDTVGKCPQEPVFSNRNIATVLQTPASSRRRTGENPEMILEGREKIQLNQNLRLDQPSPLVLSSSARKQSDLPNPTAMSFLSVPQATLKPLSLSFLPNSVPNNMTAPVSPRIPQRLSPLVLEAIMKPELNQTQLVAAASSLGVPTGVPVRLLPVKNCVQHRYSLEMPPDTASNSYEGTEQGTKPLIGRSRTVKERSRKDSDNRKLRQRRGTTVGLTEDLVSNIS